MKKILLLGLVGSFIFGGVSFNKGVSYSDLDKDSGVTVTGTMGVNFDLDKDGKMSLGWDTGRGMTVDAAAGSAGVATRLGYKGNTSSIGVGYDWWSGGDEIKTTIGTSIDYSTSGAGTDATSISLNLGWGF